EVDPVGLADPRRRVDEGDLPQAARVRLAVEERGEEVAVRVRRRLELHEPPAAELARDSVYQLAVEEERPRAAEVALGGAGLRAREDLLGRDVRRAEVAVRVALAPAQEHGHRRESHLEIGAGPAEAGPVGAR